MSVESSSIKYRLLDLGHYQLSLLHHFVIKSCFNNQDISNGNYDVYILEANIFYNNTISHCNAYKKHILFNYTQLLNKKLYHHCQYPFRSLYKLGWRESYNRVWQKTLPSMSVESSSIKYKLLDLGHYQLSLLHHFVIKSCFNNQDISNGNYDVYILEANIFYNNTISHCNAYKKHILFNYTQLLNKKLYHHCQYPFRSLYKLGWRESYNRVRQKTLPSSNNPTHPTPPPCLATDCDIWYLHWYVIHFVSNRMLSKAWAPLCLALNSPLEV